MQHPMNTLVKDRIVSNTLIWDYGCRNIDKDRPGGDGDDTDTAGNGVCNDGSGIFKEDLPQNFSVSIEMNIHYCQAQTTDGLTDADRNRIAGCPWIPNHLSIFNYLVVLGNILQDLDRYTLDSQTCGIED